MDPTTYIMCAYYSRRNGPVRGLYGCMPNRQQDLHMSQLNYWDSKAAFQIACQAVETDQAKEFQTAAYFKQLRTLPELRALRAASADAAVRPTGGFLLTRPGMSVTEFAMHDIMARTTSPTPSTPSRVETSPTPRRGPPRPRP
jgi:hypothetical protein